MMLFWLCFIHVAVGVQGFRNGAGSCDGGKPAVNGAHLEFGSKSASRRLGGNGTLAEGFTALQLDGVVAEVDKLHTVPTGRDVEWTLAVSRVPIRGFLVRMEAPAGVETAAAITCGENQTLATTCTAPIIGCTHTENSDKFQVSGSFRFDEIARGVKLDVTVVYQNNMETNGIDRTVASLYTYNQFIVDFVDDDTGTAPDSPEGNVFASFLAVIRQIIELIVSVFGAA